MNTVPEVRNELHQVIGELALPRAVHDRLRFDIELLYSGAMLYVASQVPAESVFASEPPAVGASVVETPVVAPPVVETPAVEAAST